MNKELPTLAELSKIIMNLSRLRRTGWKLSGVECAETVSEHSFDVALYSIIISTMIGDVDPACIALYALFHDIAEAYIGDIPKPRKREEDIKKEMDITLDVIRRLGVDKIIDPRILTIEASTEFKIIKLSDNLATLNKGLKYYIEGHKTPYLKQIIVNSMEEAVKWARELNLDLVVNLLEKLSEEHKEIFEQ